MPLRFLTVCDAHTINGKAIPASLHRVEICDVHGVVSSGISSISREDAIRLAKKYASLPFDLDGEIILTDLGCVDREGAVS
jgi:predicted short-subunit dehydrogenase-like oxidoreductase (DUF2520 family)